MVPAPASATATRWWRLTPVPHATPLSPPGSRRRFHVGDWCRHPFPTSFTVTDLGTRTGQGLISLRTSRAPSSSPLRGTATVARSWEEDLERILWTEAEIAARVSELAAEISEDIKGCGAEVAVVGVATGAFVFLADLVRRMGLPVAVDLIRVESYGSRTESSGAPAIVSDVRVAVEGKHVILVEDIVDTGNTLSFLISHMKLKGARTVSVCTFLDKPGRRKVEFELVGDGKFYRGFEVRIPSLFLRNLAPLSSTVVGSCHYKGSIHATGIPCGCLSYPCYVEQYIIAQRNRMFAGSFMIFGFPLIHEEKPKCLLLNGECPDYFVVGYGMDFSERCRYLPFVAVLKPEMYT